MVLVTGGTGLVGAHLLFSLVKTGLKVKAIYRNEGRVLLTKKIFGYYSEESEVLFKTIDWVKCDLNDIPALEIAFSNVTHVYHCAALISFDPNDAKKLYKTNVLGTSNIVNLCIAKQIKKLCYVSSIATIGNTLNGKSANETTEFNDVVANVYARSKHQAEMEVWRCSQEGVEIVIVNPGVILGPGFWNNGSGKIFQKISNGLRFYLPGGTGFVTVTDVVNAMVNLMNSNIANENYILVSKNLSYKAAFTTIAIALDKKAPKVLLKKWMLATLWRLDFLKSKMTGSTRVLSKKMAQSFGLATTTYSNEKIKEDLKFEFEDLDTLIQFCASIFLEENY
jgi:nucleoside-diphosphate-sugar epimerase